MKIYMLLLVMNIIKIQTSISQFKEKQANLKNLMTNKYIFKNLHLFTRIKKRKIVIIVLIKNIKNNLLNLLFNPIDLKKNFLN
jgi:hypothetical protein